MIFIIPLVFAAVALAVLWVLAWKLFFWTLRHPLAGLIATGAWLLVHGV